MNEEGKLEREISYTSILANIVTIGAIAAAACFYGLQTKINETKTRLAVIESYNIGQAVGLLDRDMNQRIDRYEWRGSGTGFELLDQDKDGDIDYDDAMAGLR